MFSLGALGPYCFVMHASRIGAVVLLAVSLLLMGCGSTPPTATSASPSPTSTMSPTLDTRTLTFQLVACTGPNVCANADPMMEGPSKFGHGTVRIDIKDGAYTVTVTVTGFTPKSTHLINMHPGTCASPNLDQYEQLIAATADSMGNLRTVISPPGSYFIPGPGKILTIHGDDLARRQTHIACVNLTN